MRAPLSSAMSAGSIVPCEQKRSQYEMRVSLELSDLMKNTSTGSHGYRSMLMADIAMIKIDNRLVRMPPLRSWAP